MEDEAVIKSLLGSEPLMGHPAICGEHPPQAHLWGAQLPVWRKGHRNTYGITVSCGEHHHRSICGTTATYGEDRSQKNLWGA